MIIIEKEFVLAKTNVKSMVLRQVKLAILKLLLKILWMNFITKSLTVHF